MRKLTRTLFLAGVVVANLTVAAAKATASDLVHTAAYDPETKKWIVVCTQCVISCNCTEEPE